MIMTIREPINEPKKVFSSAPSENEIVEGGYGTTEIPVAHATAMEIEQYPPETIREPTKLQTAEPTGAPVFRASATQIQSNNLRTRKDCCDCRNQTCCCIASIVSAVVFLCCVLPVIIFFVVAGRIASEINNGNITFDDDFYTGTDDFYTSSAKVDDFLNQFFNDNGLGN